MLLKDTKSYIVELMQKETKSFDGTKIAYHIKRCKTRWFLVFLHGAGGDCKAWDVERHFFHSRGVSTLALDMRGHGLSGRPQHFADYSLDHFARDVHHVLEHEGIRHFILVGHCFGGMVSMGYQKLFPNQAKSYVFIDTTDKAPLVLEVLDNAPFLRGMINLILDNTPVRDRHFSHINYQPYIGSSDLDPRRLASDIHHMSFKSWLFVYETIAGFNATEVLYTITRPSLVIHGERDTIFSKTVAEDIFNRIQSATLDFIPEANHIIVTNNPTELEQGIWIFLNSIKREIRIRIHEGERPWMRWLKSTQSNTEDADSSG